MLELYFDNKKPNTLYQRVHNNERNKKMQLTEQIQTRAATGEFEDSKLFVYCMYIDLFVTCFVFLIFWLLFSAYIG